MGHIFTLSLFLKMCDASILRKAVSVQSVGKGMSECSDEPLLHAASVPGVTLLLLGSISDLPNKLNQDLCCS